MVKQGYKQTEVGIIPNTWQVISLQNLCVQNGIVRGPFGGALKKEIFVAEGYKVYEQGNAIYKTVTRGSYYIDAAKYNKMLRFSVREGDFIVSCSGTIGMIFQIPINAPKGIINQALLKLTINDAVVNPQYFYLYFSCDSFTRRIVDDTQGGAMKNLVGMDVFRNTPFPIPPMPEQKNISIVLADITDLITNLEAIIAKKKAIKQGTMQELLTGKRRLPGFSEKWEEKPISFFGNFVSGNCFPIKYQGCPSGELPFYKVSDFNNIGNSRVMDKANNYISHNVASVLSCKIIPKNSVVFAKIGAAISLERKRITGCDCCIDNNMMSFLPYQKNIATYMCYLLQTICFGEFVEATALPSLSGKTIGEIQRTFPPTIEEQIAIATVLSDLDSEIEALEQKLTKYRQVKQGMMQQLLTGKIRLV